MPERMACHYALKGFIVNVSEHDWSHSVHLVDKHSLYDPNKVICGIGAGDSKGYRDGDGTWRLPRRTVSLSRCPRMQKMQFW
jgi:hypothetical protein